MTLFAPSDAPRVFAEPLGVDFSEALVAGLRTRLAGQPPEAIASEPRNADSMGASSKDPTGASPWQSMGAVP